MLMSLVPTADCATPLKRDAEDVDPSILSPSNDIHQQRADDKLGIPYSDVGLNYPRLQSDNTLKNLLETYLGDCWKLPDDNRLPLNFLFNRLPLWTDPAGLLDSPTPTAQQAYLVQELERLHQFDADLRAQPGNDFLLIDYDSKGNRQLYRIGQKMAGSQLKISLDQPSYCQWSRIMYIHHPPPFWQSDMETVSIKA